LLLWSFRLQRIRRYIGQPYWDGESQDARYADRLEGFPRLETVAEHSWSVADAVLILGWRFPYLDISHAVKLAILHDKMEIEIGDWNPLGRDGTGDRGHAFDTGRAMSKEEAERRAIESYVAKLEPLNRSVQHALLTEALECRSPESRYVKGLDKMSALAFILLKKDGQLDQKHVRFLLRFTYFNNRYFPPLAAHSDELLRRNLVRYCNRNKLGLSSIKSLIWDESQLEFEFPEPVPISIGVSGGPVREVRGEDIPGKPTRLEKVFGALAGLRPARTGIEAQTQLANCLNRVEDEYWPDVWAPPRYYPPGAETARLYPIGPDSIYSVGGWLVDVLVSGGEIIYISAGGAIEVREKPRDRSIVIGRPGPECRVRFKKCDSRGRGVWDAVWRQP
jgi:5'-deoxynucleotidase YfbR-like HD superfamily hydrolase